MEAQYASVWEKNSDVIPDKIALICGDNEVTWKEYDERAAKLASLLHQAGLGDDSKVGLYLHNSNEYLEAQYSVFKIKGVPINCLLYTSPSPRDATLSRMPSSA